MKRPRTLLLKVLLACALVLAGAGSSVAAAGTGAAESASLPASKVWPSILLPGDLDSLEIERDQPRILFDPRNILVKFRPGMVPSVEQPATGLTAVDATLARQGIQSARPLFPGAVAAANARGMAENPYNAELARIYELTIPRDGDVLAVVTALAQDPAVEWAEPDYLAFAADTTPNDPLFAEQWGLSQVRAPRAWDVVTGTPFVVIAVLDSGLDTSHPDLTSKVWTNPAEVPGDGVDNDSNGYVDDVWGWDFVNEDNDPADDHVNPRERRQ